MNKRDRLELNSDNNDVLVLKRKVRSFVGMEPVPIIHACASGEMIKIINGEGWLVNTEKYEKISVVS